MSTPKIVGWEHVHRHTDYSLLDGFGTVEEYAQYSKDVNQQYLCITDHGMMGAIPRQIKACEKHDLNAIFGIEAYVHPHQPKVPLGMKTGDVIKEWDPDLKATMRKSFHMLMLAENAKGYENLVAMSSWGWRHGVYYGRPRISHEIIRRHREGVIFSTCCYMGEVGQAFDVAGADAAEAKLLELIELVGGKDRLVMEMMLLDFEKQRPFNLFVIEMTQKHGLKLVVSQDCHYCKKEDSKYQQYMMIIQNKKTLADIQSELDRARREGREADLFELQDTNLWMKSEEELNEKWASDFSTDFDGEILDLAKRNTVELCRRCGGVELDRSLKLPTIPEADLKLWEACLRGFATRKLPKTRIYVNRLREEYDVITRKGFSSYFLIQKKMTDEGRRWWKANSNSRTGHEAVGPGRGSAGGSLICYCLGITDVDPIRHDLLFNRFLSPARGGKTMRIRFEKVEPIEVPHGETIGGVED